MAWTMKITVLQFILSSTLVWCKDVPDFVKTYAPVVYLQSEDPYMPSDYEEFLNHVYPVDQVNHTVPSDPNPLTLDNLNELNYEGGSNIFLTSKEGIQANPDWFKGQDPSSSEAKNNVAVITTDMNNGTIYAFYFYWYNYNEGDTVVGLEFGDHVGDCQHSDGFAYSWDIVEKEGDRPIVYSAKGSHANYATSGKQDRHDVNAAIPPGFLIEQTDKGKRWDTVSNAHYYEFNRVQQSLSAYTDGTPVNWLYFKGQWGDAQLPKGTKGQFGLFGQYKYSSGPQGPIYKKLDRETMCIKGCTVQTSPLNKTSDSAIEAAMEKALTEFDEKGASIIEKILKAL
ncbi:hypothetical protein KEM56_001495 [Ascosphaera pollenicola]|nr:hypothetical protein KEM56_001495 [Ascosphaera pollenicola]